MERSNEMWSLNEEPVLRPSVQCPGLSGSLELGGQLTWKPKLARLTAMLLAAGVGCMDPYRLGKLAFACAGFKI